MKKTAPCLMFRKILGSCAFASTVFLVAGCLPPASSAPPQEECPASLGGTLSLHDVNSLSTYPTPEWGGWTADIHNTHHAANEVTINPGNVSSLELKWRFEATGSVVATPTIEGDMMYFPDSGPGIVPGNNFAGSKLFAVDRNTGIEVWSKLIRDYNDNDFGSMAQKNSPTIAGDLIIIGDHQNPAPMSFFRKLTTHGGRYQLGYDDPCAGYVTAIKRDGLNAGEMVWSTRIGEDDYAMVSQSAAVYGDTVFIGLSSQESTYGRHENFPIGIHRGKVVALDVHTGAEKWTTYMVPETFGGIQGFSGVSVWGGAPTIDEPRGLVYVPTGNNFTVPQAYEDCMFAAGNDLTDQATCTATWNVSDNYVDSIVALNITTGAIEWSFRSVDYDPWNTACDFEDIMPIVATSSSTANCAIVKGPDADFAQPPMLYILKDGNGNSRFFDSFGDPVLTDSSGGSILYDANGDATYLDAGGNSVTINGVTKQLLAAGNKGGQFFILDPDNAGSVVSGDQVGPGGMIGGMEFGSATDGERLYVQNVNFNHKPHTLTKPSPDFVVPEGEPQKTIYGGFWAALDAETGDILWETPVPSAVEDPALLEGGISHLVWGSRHGEGFFAWPYASPTVANGVVYAAVANMAGSFVAMDAATGKILWNYSSGSGSVAAPAIVDGRIYWGNGSKYAKGGGKYMHSFGLPE